MEVTLWCGVSLHVVGLTILGVHYRQVGGAPHVGGLANRASFAPRSRLILYKLVAVLVGAPRPATGEDVAGGTGHPHIVEAGTTRPGAAEVEEEDEEK